MIERKQLSREDHEFIGSIIDKELFFDAGEESNDLIRLIGFYVNWEKEKLENEEIGSDDYAGDIARAASILDTLSYKEEE